MVLLPEERYHRLLKIQKEYLQSQDSTFVEQLPVGDIEEREPQVHVVGEDESNPSDRLSIDLIIGGIPKQFKAKARALLEYIGRSNILGWNKRGELLLEGKPCPGTHIADLIRHTMRSYKNFNPTGLNEFYSSLKLINVPLGLIGNSEVWADVDAQQLTPSAPPGVLDQSNSVVKKQLSTVGSRWVSLS